MLEKRKIIIISGRVSVATVECLIGRHCSTFWSRIITSFLITAQQFLALFVLTSIFAKSPRQTLSFFFQNHYFQASYILLSFLFFLFFLLFVLFALFRWCSVLLLEFLWNQNDKNIFFSQAQPTKRQNIYTACWIWCSSI